MSPNTSETPCFELLPCAGTPFQKIFSCCQPPPSKAATRSANSSKTSDVSGLKPASQLNSSQEQAEDSSPSLVKPIVAGSNGMKTLQTNSDKRLELLKVLLSMILIVLAMTVALIYAGRMIAQGVSTFIQVLEKLGVEMKDHAESFTRETMHTYVDSPSSQQYTGADLRASMRPLTLPTSNRHLMFSPARLTGAQNAAASSSKSIALPSLQNTKLGRQVAIRTILRVAGAPYAASMLRKLSVLIVVVGGFLSKVSQYARTNELEYFSME
jgi:hypothetical protein